MNNKKPSGAQYRKRRAERTEEQAKQEGSFLRFLKKQKSSTGLPEEPGSETLQREISTDKKITVPFPTNEETQTRASELNQYNTVQALQPLEPELDYSDPATWPSVTDGNITEFLVQKGPRQVCDQDFPKDSHNRRFSQIHYRRKLANGEEICRSWLMYSRSRNVVICFCCKLFCKKIGISSVQENGCKDWKNISAILSSHERSPWHLESYRAWRELEMRLSEGKTINEINQQQIKQEEEYWKQVLERLIALTRTLGMQNLPFRGSNERLFTSGNGNFLKFVEYLALFDPLMKEHLRRVTDKETYVHYLGKDIQNELIQILATEIKQRITETVKSAKYYSVILDCTPDVSNIEQMTMIIRFVNLNETEVLIREHFLGFIQLQETTGVFLTEVLIQQLKDMGLKVENMRGQGYDNGSNMKGKENGVQKKILNLNPRAFFVPCSAHSLNLVVNDAVKSCLEAVNFFGLVQKISIFFSGSTRRWGVLKRHISSLSELTVKPLSETRWESRIDALKPLRYNLENVYDALIEIYEDTSQKGYVGVTTRSEAQALANNIAKFPFIVSLITWYNILFEVNVTSKLLQETTTDLRLVIKQLENTKKYISSLRSEESFLKILVDATDIARKLEIEPTFEASQVRQRRKKRQFDYESQDEPVQDAKENYKVNFYYAILDVATESINERFNQIQKHSTSFGFLYDIFNISELSSDDIFSKCRSLENSLTHGASKDIDAEELHGELQSIARRLPKSMHPREVLHFLLQHKLIESYPNISVALRILLTLPVSVASGERSFSKLKLIKNYLRSTMSQDRLVGLATISIESELASSLDIENMICQFAKKKARKMKL